MIREIIGWFLAIETILAVCAIFTDDWWEWYKAYHLVTFVSVVAVLWIGLIKWLITGTLF